MGGAIISELGGGIIPLRGATSSRNWGAASSGISTWTCRSQQLVLETAADGRRFGGRRDGAATRPYRPLRRLAA